MVGNYEKKRKANDSGGSDAHAPRRSNRERKKQTMTVYDEAEAEATLAVAAVGSGGKKSAKASTGKRKRGGAGKKTAPPATGRKSGMVISSRRRKAGAENYKKTKMAKKVAITISEKKRFCQLFVSLAESKKCDIVQVVLCRDDNNELRPCFAVTNADDVIEGIQTANPTLKLDNYGRKKGRGPPSSEAKLNAFCCMFMDFGNCHQKV